MSNNAPLNFNKNGVVSVWYSTMPFSRIPDSYFKVDKQGLTPWAHNFHIGPYNEENMETNGREKGTVSARRAVGECSFSSSFADGVVQKIKKLGDEQVTWMILLYDFEYRPKKTKAFEDDVVKYVGAFPYDHEADSLFEPDPTATS